MSAPPIDPPAVYYAELCARSYSDTPTYGKASDAGRALVYNSVVTLPGTDNKQSVLADGDIETVTIEHIGTVHAGFWGALAPIRQPLVDLSPLIITGHSEGADEALLLGGVLCAAGKPPTAIYAFEPARLCMDAMLRGLLESHGVMVFATKNGNDLVPDVPPWMQHPCDLALIGKPILPIPNIQDHLIENVIKSLQA